MFEHRVAGAALARMVEEAAARLQINSVDATRLINERISKEGVHSGIVNIVVDRSVTSNHLLVQENEEGLVCDLHLFMREFLFPRSLFNFLPTDILSLNIHKGELDLGTWQSVLLVGDTENLQDPHLISRAVRCDIHQYSGEPIYLTLNLGPDDLSLMDGVDERVRYRNFADDLRRVVRWASVRNGLLNIQTKHTTTGFTSYGNAKDTEQRVQGFVREVFRWGAGQKFAHDRDERIESLGGSEPRNAISHFLAASSSFSKIFRVRNGELCVGAGESAIFMDYDVGPHHPGRQLSVVVLEGV